MRNQAYPLTQDLVLVGGGHSHALVLRQWGMDPLPGVRVTVINPGPTAPYSGMLPGHLAGHYDRDALDIDLVKLARFAGARVVLGAADGIDLERREVHVPGRPPIGFDIASLDVGITSEMPDLPGFADHGIPAKPLGSFAANWAAYRQGKGPASVAVIGGGVAGVEIAMALAHALHSDARPAKVHLLERGHLLSGLRPASARRLRQALQDAGVVVIEDAQIVQITPDGVQLDDARMIEAQFVTGAAGARPHDWLRQTGLALQDGFVNVDSRLRSSDTAIFAVGDCANMVNSPRPKAGVYAVRQAPVLFENLRAALAGTGGLREYRPQKDYLKLISLGRKSALVDRFGVCLSGPPLWRWKDRIDQSFMDKFRALPKMAAPHLPWPRARGMKEAIGPKPLCGGCGSKVGRATLMQALGAQGGPGDDAGILQTGGATQVISTDHLRAMVEDPVMMARIAAIHALGDIWAMGADPQAATASIILPRQSATLADRSLGEIMQAASAVLDAAGAKLVGGHSTQGAELTIGFTLTGLCARAPITLAGAQPGDALVLTKPIGSGVVMAAEMAGEAKGAWVARALDLMVQPQAKAAALLSGAHAMTDVTGFGLAGHLLNICMASGVGARLDLGAIPLMLGSQELSQAGTRSSIYADNRSALPHLPDDPSTALLFDPQTGGGLLAAVPGDATGLVDSLRSAGYEAAQIGRITDQMGQITID